MSLATLDTYEVVKDLRSSGFTDVQAEAVARNLRKAQDLDLSTLATNAGLSDVRTVLQAEIMLVRTDLTGEIAKVRTDLMGEIEKVRTELMGEIEKVRTMVADSKAEVLKWMFGAIGFQTLVILGGVVALMKTMKP